MIQVQSHQQPYGQNQRLYVDGFHHNNNNKTNVVCISRRNRTLSVASTLLLLIFFLSILQLELVHSFTVSYVPSLLLPPPSHTFHLQQQQHQHSRIIVSNSVVVVQSSRWDEDTNNNNDNSNEITSNNTATTSTSTTSITTSSTGSNIDIELEQQINQGLQRAKEVLQKSKAKLAAMERSNNGGTDQNNNEEVVVVTNNVPFFATRLPISTTTTVAGVAGGVAMAMTTTIVSEDTIRTTTTTPTKITDRNMKVKSRNSDTGLVMADGERMAEISEYEPWEYRSIYELFPNVNDGDDDNDANGPTSQSPRRVEIQTDVMASIQNLRKVLQTEDYRKIFDPRNRFIGEDN